MTSSQRFGISEILQEIENRRAHLDSRVEQHRNYLRVVPSCRDRTRLEREILAAAAASLELESLQNIILGREE